MKKNSASATETHQGKLDAFGQIALRFAGVMTGTAIGQALTGRGAHWGDAAGIALITVCLLTAWEKFMGRPAKAPKLGKGNKAP